MKDRMASIILPAKTSEAAAEAREARLVVMDRENTGLGNAAELRKKKRAGFTVKNSVRIGWPLRKSLRKGGRRRL